MNKMIYVFTTSLLLTMAQAFAAPLTLPNPVRQTEDLQQAIRDYILEHPEVLIESLQKYEERSQNDSEKGRKLALESLRPSLVTAHDLILGNPNGTKELIAFFDYRCGYCKKTLPVLDKMIAEYPDLKIVIKEYPVLGTQSINATKIAFAAAKQDKYSQAYHALMTYKGPWDTDALLDFVAKKTGANKEQLVKDMDSMEIQTFISQNQDLGMKLKLYGTPAFIYGDHIIDGAPNEEGFKKLLSSQ